MNTNYFLDLLAGNIFGTKKDPALPAQYFIGLSSTAPNAEGTGVTEPVGMGYSRVELTGMSQPSGGIVNNGSPVDFPISTGDWGVMTHFVIYDAKESGNLLMYNPLKAQRTVEIDTIMTIRPGELKLSAVTPA